MKTELANVAERLLQTLVICCFLVHFPIFATLIDSYAIYFYLPLFMRTIINSCLDHTSYIGEKDRQKRLITPKLLW